MEVKTLLLELVLPVLFVVQGLFLLAGRGAWLITGYNTMMLPSKRKNFDRPAFCRFMAKVMFCGAGCLMLIILGEWVSSKALFVAGAVLLFVGVVFTWVYANTGHRFERK